MRAVLAWNEASGRGEQRGTKDELLVSGVLVGEASTRADK